MRRALLATLLSSITLTAAASPVPQLNDAPAPTSRPVSTGVTEPHLIYTTSIGIPADELPTTVGSSLKVALKVDIDELGRPFSIQILRGISPEINQRVVEAVRQFRWAPAVLNNKPVPDELTLNVQVQR